jgi:putative transcriptional regulator
MSCDECGDTMSVARENYRYEPSHGFFVILRDVEVGRCPQCGKAEVAIPRIAQLHRLLATLLVWKPGRLGAPEVRYLRKHLGWSGTDFAAHMGVRPETVSRWETGKSEMEPVAERALRLMVATRDPVKKYPLERLKQIDQPSRGQRLDVELHANEWRAVAA